MVGLPLSGQLLSVLSASLELDGKNIKNIRFQCYYQDPENDTSTRDKHLVHNIWVGGHHWHLLLKEINTMLHMSENNEVQDFI